MANSIPKFRERESEWKIPFQTFGNGNASGNSIPNFRKREGKLKFHSRLSGREFEAGIPGNDREMTGNDREMAGIGRNGNGKFHSQISGTERK